MTMLPSKVSRFCVSMKASLKRVLPQRVMTLYETEIDDIKQRVDEIWTVFKKILARLDHADD